MRKFLHAVVTRLKDLFYDPTNTKLDIGRVTGALALLYLIRATEANIHLHKEIDLSPTGLAGGLATVLAAAATYLIYDRTRSTKE